MNKIYHGIAREGHRNVIEDHSVFIEVNGVRKHLPYYSHIKNHSPTGFCWGYGGSGPAQLALALLCDATGDVKLAERYYMRFKDLVIAALNMDADFRLSAIEIDEWLTMQILKDKQ